MPALWDPEEIVLYPDTDAPGSDSRATARLFTTPGHLLRRSLGVYNAIWLEEVADPTSSQFAVLTALAVAPRIDQRALGDLASLDRSSMTDVVRRLARRAWITKSRDPGDARRHVLELTPPAAHALGHLNVRADVVHRRFLEPLGPAAQEELLEGLSRIAPTGERGPGPAALSTPGLLVRRAQQVHASIFTDEFGDTLTGPQFAILHALEAQPGISHRTLRGIVGIDRTTVTGIVDRLALRGWIDRANDPTDARRFKLSLTPEALHAHAEFTPRVLRVQDRLMADFDDAGRTRLIELLRTVVAQWDSGHPPGGA